MEATGATYYPHVHALDRDVSRLDAEFPQRAKLKGLAKFKFDMREVFIAAVPGQVADLEALLDEVRPGVIVAEPGVAAAARVIEQRHGVPWATYNISAFAMRSIDSAPFGLGLQLREAVRKVLREPEHADRAVAMQAEMADHGGAGHAADLLERLAATGAPVPATTATPAVDAVGTLS